MFGGGINIISVVVRLGGHVPSDLFGSLVREHCSGALFESLVGTFAPGTLRSEQGSWPSPELGVRTGPEQGARTDPKQEASTKPDHEHGY